MDNDEADVDLWKDVVLTPAEEQALRDEAQSFLNELKSKRVCLYTGKARGALVINSFKDCLNFLGDCDILLFEEPVRSLGAIEQEFDELKRTLAGKHQLVAGSIRITKVEQVSHTVYATPFFPEVDTKWFPDLPVSNRDARKWIHAAEVEFDLLPQPRKSRHRKIRVFHIGLSGNAAWALLLAPNQIQPKIIIGSPR